MANHCLVCGSQKSGKQYLVNKLIPDVEINDVKDNHSQCIWNVVNKYYASDITLTIINSTTKLITPNTGSNKSKADEDKSKMDWTQFQAVILVLNLSQPQVQYVFLRSIITY